MLKNEYMKRYNKGIICLLAGAAMFAACQDDWETFLVMRESQFETWPDSLLEDTDASLADTEELTEEQTQWFDEHWMLQYDLMFGQEYALGEQ